MAAVVKYKILRVTTDDALGCGSEESFPLEVSIDEPTKAVNWLLFKDTTNGKKYKLQITNGVVELVEVT